ncbi:MAG: photosystem II protein Y [Planktothrix sp. GU0601_MAG3]|nr:MAG: photosystem II protein Y [Planktothrix sp. GU0601_MAG3]
MDFDFRILIVLLPLVAALGWVFVNIGAVVIGQVQRFLSKS